MFLRASLNQYPAELLNSSGGINVRYDRHRLLPQQKNLVLVADKTHSIRAYSPLSQDHSTTLPIDVSWHQFPNKLFALSFVCCQGNPTQDNLLILSESYEHSKKM